MTWSQSSFRTSKSSRITSATEFVRCYCYLTVGALFHYKCEAYIDHYANILVSHDYY
jgi:hypothetical protein